MLFFETDYSKINIKEIHSIKESSKSLQFKDSNNFYSFNYSKSTLFRKFYIPDNAFRLSVKILEDPYTLLLELLENKSLQVAKKVLTRGIDYVILPLYGYKNKQKFVFERSGLNQWNARGRKRNQGEVYIPIPQEIHTQFPNFFPARDEVFDLETPTRDVFSARVCQDNSKALMTNPNNLLSNWLLRSVFQLEVGELLTIDKINEIGCDSVIIIKERNGKYKIDIAKFNGYEQFIKNEY